MSKYTTELRYVCEVAAGLDESVGVGQVNKVIEAARPKIFDFPYPIFDEEYKPVIETKILKHFYLREISSETVGIWRLWLDDTLNDIMPYYNQLYKSALLKFNPLIDTDYTIQHQGSGNRTEDVNRNNERTEKDKKTETENNKTTKNSTENVTSSGERHDGGGSESSGTSGGTDSNYNMFSDTPEGGVQGISGDFLTDDTTTLFLSDVRRTEDVKTGSTHDETMYEDSRTEVGSSESVADEIKEGEINRGYVKDVTEGMTDKRVGNFNNTDEFLNHIIGKRSSFVSYSKMLKEFRETMLNIDMMILNELEPLFFGLW